MELEGKIERVVIAEEELQQRIGELAAQIERDYRELLGERIWESPPIAIGLLRGAVIFLADLVRKIKIPLEYDFISISSYGDATYPGEIRLVKDLEISITDRDILVVDEIIDTGQTLSYLKGLLLERRPRSLRICCLIDKLPRRKVELPLDYVGFRFEEDRFLIGYGLDYAGLYRNLPYIASLKPEAIAGQGGEPHEERRGARAGTGQS